MTSKLSTKEFALLDQITNSFWSFLMMRILYSESDARQIGFLGMTLIFAYGCSGFLRSKFVHPLYGGFGIRYQTEKFNPLPILKGHLPRYFILYISLFIVFLKLNSTRSSRFLFELVVLMISIVLLDFLRSFLQLNSDFIFAVLANILGICVYFLLIKFESYKSLHLEAFNPIDFWIFSNLVVAFGIMIFLMTLTIRNDTLISPLQNLALNYEKISTLSKIDFVQGRLINLAGNSILMKFNEQMAANLTLALFIYSTLPFSVINGLSPYYLRNRKLINSKLSLRKYLSYISFATLIMPIFTVISQSSINVIFGTNQQTQISLIFFVILMVFQKFYESATSLDSMIQLSVLRYSSIKVIITINVYLVAPITLGLGCNALGIFILVAVIITQILFLRKSEE